MKAHEGAGPERPHAAAYAKAQLVCREVREDLVALERDELSPLRAESVRQHLTSCPECREEALELDLAVRSLGKLPEVSPPRGLADRTMGRVLDRTEGAHGLAAQPVGPSVPAHSEAARAGGDAPVPPAVDTPRPAEAASGDGGWAGGETCETVILPRQLGIFRRPIKNPFARAAVAAVLFLAFDGMAFMVVADQDFADAVGRAHHRVLGPRASEAVHRATDAFLARLRL